MAAKSAMVHVLLVSFPGQGHVNPLLRLAKRLASKGLLVTFSAPHYVGHRMKEAMDDIATTATTVGAGQLRFEFFSDGWDVTDPIRNDLDALMSQLERVGPQALTDLIHKQANDGRPVSCIINNPFMPWVVDVAADMCVPSAVLWVQSCAVFSAYYHYFHGLINFPTEMDSDISVQLPGLPLFSAEDLPTFLLPSNPYGCLKEVILAQFKSLPKASWVLVESFEELEPDALRYISSISLIKPIGPLFKLANEGDSVVRGDMWKATNCIDWLDSQLPSSVIYVSFGSVVVLDKVQIEEIAWGIKNSGIPFLWVLKPVKNSKETGLPIWFAEEMAEKGIVVPWCPQEKVLSHSSISCFFTHCGWNSCMESLSLGVPILAFPQWGDQMPNAKFLVDIFKVGVRLRGCANGNLVSKEEVERCIFEAMKGPKAEEIKKNALKWKEKAEEAVSEGGSSDRNMQAFIDDVRSRASSGCGVVIANN